MRYVAAAALDEPMRRMGILLHPLRTSIHAIPIEVLGIANRRYGVQSVRLSTRARYAMHLMIEVARRTDAPTSLREVTDRTRISRRYLDQLATSLKNANLLRSQSGHGGGYRLTRPAARIAVRDIVEAAIGPINIVECVRRPETCLKSELCECRIVYALINHRILDLLRDISLADMADKDWLRRAERELALVTPIACTAPPLGMRRKGAAHD